MFTWFFCQYCQILTFERICQMLSKSNILLAHLIYITCPFNILLCAVEYILLEYMEYSYDFD